MAPSRCPICSEALSNDSSRTLKKHNRNRAHFPCAQCKIPLSTAEKLQKHLQKHAQNSIPPVTAAKPRAPIAYSTTVCPVCNATIACRATKSGRSKAILKHIKKQGHFRCQICMKKFTTMAGLHDHAKTLHQSIPRSSLYQVAPVPVSQNPLAGPSQGATWISPGFPTTGSVPFAPMNIHPRTPDSHFRLPEHDNLTLQSKSPSVASSESDPTPAVEEGPLPELQPWHEIEGMGDVPRQRSLGLSKRLEDSDTEQSESESQSSSDSESSSPQSDAGKSDDDEEQSLWDSNSDSSDVRRLIARRVTRAMGKDARKDKGKISNSAVAWDCRVCSKAPTDPVTTMCGHIFCHGCITREMSKSLRCPTCKKAMLIRLNPR